MTGIELPPWMREPADAIRVRGDEILIVRLPADTPREAVDQMAELLDEVGLAHRSLVIAGHIDLAVVAAPAALAEKLEEVRHQGMQTLAAVETLLEGGN